MLAVQPSIRLTRSFDPRCHSYLGYVLRIQGMLDGEVREFVVAVGKAAQEKHGFRAGDQVEGNGEPVADARLETADLYKASGLKVIGRGPEPAGDEPPFIGVPPPLEVYRERATAAGGPDVRDEVHEPPLDLFADDPFPEES